MSEQKEQHPLKEKRESYHGKERAYQHWHLDKRVPLALIFTILSGYMGGIYWVTKTIDQVDHNRHEIEAVKKQSSQFNEVSTRVTRLEVYLSEIKDTLKDIQRDIRESRSRNRSNR